MSLEKKYDILWAIVAILVFIEIGVMEHEKINEIPPPPPAQWWPWMRPGVHGVPPERLGSAHEERAVQQVDADQTRMA